MKFKNYFLKINTAIDPEAANLLDRRLTKQGLSLGEFRKIKDAINLLFPKVDVKIISSEVIRKPVTRVL